jgi:FkbM family methyltransferase
MALFHLFPYHLVDKGSKIILAGCGEVGRCFAEQISENNYAEIVAISDRNYQKCEPVCEIDVVPPQKIALYQCDKIVIAVGDDNKNSVISDLISQGISNEKIISGSYPHHCITPIETTDALIIRDVFKAIGIEKPSYIDVGACHPHMSSNTMPFYLMGSRGINIEPDEALRDEFALHRPEDINLFVGIAVAEGIGAFYKCSANPYLSTFSEQAIKWSEEHWNAEYDDGVTSVPLMTLNRVVDEYCGGIFPDFLDIDIEGMDAEVLRSCDFSESSPMLILVEGIISVFNQILMNKECEGGGYTPYCRISCNTVYLRNDIYKRVLSLD